MALARPPAAAICRLIVPGPAATSATRGDGGSAASSMAARAYTSKCRSASAAYAGATRSHGSAVESGLAAATLDTARVYRTAAKTGVRSTTSKSNAR